MTTDKTNTTGSVLVVGGGIGGIQSAIDLADSGFHVYLVEKSHTLGGTMAALDKTFPTNDCATCMFSPKLVQVANHPSVEILTLSRLVDLTGKPGNFTATVEQQPRFIDENKCIACGACAEKCPKKVPDPFNGNLGDRKAAFLTFPQAVPRIYALDPGHCLYLTKGKCGVCQKICPTRAVDYDQKAALHQLRVGAVILSTGFELALKEDQGEFGYGRYPNVISSLQYERLLSATGPTQGHIQRPSDGRTPQKIAWIQCVMSRDAARNRPFCSSVCCMHAAKQAVMTRTHVPETETTIYFMDVRAHGKGFDDYVERARHQHGVNYRRSMISQVYQNPENDTIIIETFDHDLNKKVEQAYDLVVLSSGFSPSREFTELAERLNIVTNAYGFLSTAFDEPVSTSRPGIFVCGGIEAPKDIPETVIQAGTAAAEASMLLADARNSDVHIEATTDESAAHSEARVGVFVCHCGTNIAGVVDVEAIVEYAGSLPGVVHATHFVFTCAADTQKELIEAIRKFDINRVVVAACSPRTHEPLFRETLQNAGLNPYLFEMASIRDQCAWVHTEDPDKATAKAKALVRASAARAVQLEPLKDPVFHVKNEALVIGAGIAGMTAALTIADQGFQVHLVEKSEEVGGFARRLSFTLDGHSPRRLLRYLGERTRNHPNVSLYLKSRLTAHRGHVGNFQGTVATGDRTGEIAYGAVVVASGGQAYEPEEYLFGKNERVITQVEFSKRLLERPGWAKSLRRIVMIQCVGSRNDTFSYCSRVCCSAAVKNSIRLKEMNPDAQVVVLYRDVRTFGFKELYYLKARKDGALFFRYVPEDPPEVFDSNGRLTVDFTDRGSHQPFRMEPDLVVLSVGMRASEGAKQIAQLLKLPQTKEGFFLEAHVKLRPVDMATPGIFLAGLAHSPRFIEESIAMAKSAGQQAVKILCKKEMTTSAAVAEVDPEKCAACLVCVKVCPYGAPSISDEGASHIPPSACMGCGICASECPASAITLKHATDSQILAKIDALLEPMI